MNTSSNPLTSNGARIGARSPYIPTLCRVSWTLKRVGYFRIVPTRTIFRCSPRCSFFGPRCTLWC